MSDKSSNPDARILGKSGGKLDLHGLAAVRDASADLTAQAERSLLLFSRTLDPRIYDQQPFLDGIQRLAMFSEHSRIRILLLDNQRLVKYNHRLLEVARRLTSRIELRRPIAEYAERGDEYLVADLSGYLYREHAGEYDGHADFHDLLQAQQLQDQFDEAWEHAQPDPDLRRLYL